MNLEIKMKEILNRKQLKFIQKKTNQILIFCAGINEHPFYRKTEDEKIETFHSRLLAEAKRVLKFK